MSISQDNWKIAIDSPLGQDVLLLKSFTAEEWINSTFLIRAEVYLEPKKAEIDSLIGQAVTIRWDISSTEKRYFNGHVIKISFLSDALETPYELHPRYMLEIRPWTWFLMHRSSCELFENKTANDIIKAKCGDAYPSGNLEYSLTTKPSRPICIQYGESDFNFLSRLMEEEGIYYYFEHEEGKHTWLLLDKKAGHKPCPGYEKIPYRKLTRDDSQHVTQFFPNYNFCSGGFLTTGYSPDEPSEDNFNAKVDESFKPLCEIFQVGSFPTFKGESSYYAQIGLERLTAQKEVYFGRANAYGIACGYTFELTDHPESAFNKKYLVVGTNISVGHQMGTEYAEDISFSVISADTQYRAQCVTSRPVMGSQTAVVTAAGKGDNLGKVQIKFHWDTDGSGTMSESWLRVAQPCANQDFGTFFIPREGQEVLVTFVDGDPSQPLVVGAIYNGENKPAPDFTDPEKHSGIVTKNNKIVFTDSDSPDNSKTEFETAGNLNAKIDKEGDIEYGKKLSVKVGDDGMTEEVAGDVALTYQKNLTSEIGKDETITVKGNLTSDIKGNSTSTVTGDLTSTIKGDSTSNVTGDLTLKGKNIKNTGQQTIESKAGQASLKLGTTDAEIKGANLTFKGDKNALLGSGSETTIKGGDIQIKGGTDKWKNTTLEINSNKVNVKGQKVNLG